MSRPKKDGDTTRLEFTVPAGVHEYLTAHAKRAIIGATPNEVARFLLISSVTKLIEQSYLGVEMPKKDRVDGK